jgi:hypothetical protein
MNAGSQNIFRILRENRAEIRRYGVRRLRLFGSCVHGEDTGQSDLDFLVDLETKSFDAYMDLKAFMEDLFGRPVDLVLADTIKPRLRSTILSEAVNVPGL